MTRYGLKAQRSGTLSLWCEKCARCTPHTMNIQHPLSIGLGRWQRRPERYECVDCRATTFGHEEDGRNAA